MESYEKTDIYFKLNNLVSQQCAGLCDRNLLKIHVSKTFPLAQAGAAHELLETGSVTGKIVLEIPGD